MYEWREKRTDREQKDKTWIQTKDFFKDNEKTRREEDILTDRPRE